MLLATLITIWVAWASSVWLALQSFSNKAPQKPTSRAGIYSYTLSREDRAEIPTGEWEVAFFNNKTLLASGTITVGGDAAQGLSDAIVVKGTIVHAKTRQPIRNALVVLLNEGIDAETYLNDPQDSDVYTSATTDARGKFVLNEPIERTAEHTWIIAAKGYKPIVEDALVIGDGAEDPLELTITLTK
jgi:hypothetical protein